jgi:hypothetical protein
MNVLRGHDRLYSTSYLETWEVGLVSFY